MSDLVTLSDNGKEVGRLELSSGRRYDMDGRYVSTMSQELGPEERGMLAKAHIHNDVDLNRNLSLYAANYDVSKRGAALRKKLALKNAGRSGETKVLMDLGVGDVHIPSAMSNIALGYHLLDGVADIALPVIPTVKQSDYWFTWSSANAFTPVAVGMAATGGSPQEVSPALSKTQYTAQEYALASYVPTEVEANADAPLQPYQAAVDMVMAKLRMAREFRVEALLTTSGNWNSNNVLALATGQQWNNGGSSDPVANIHYICDRSYDTVTRIVMGRPVFEALQRNQAVRAYHFAKTNDPALPNAQELSRILELPPIIVADMKYTNASGAPTYVWPSVAGSASSVVLLHEPSQNPPTSGRDNATGYTYRWTGAQAADGTVTGGFLVRSYYDNRRGARGGRVIVIVHNDAEVVTGSILGALITGVIA